MSKYQRFRGLYEHKQLYISRIVIPRSHDTTGCQTGCTTGMTTGCTDDTAGYETGCQTGLTIGLTASCIV